MKMNYLLNRSFRAGKKPATRFRVFFVVFFLLLAFFFWRPELVRAPLSAVAAPLWRTGNALGNRIGRIAQFMQSKRTLVAEIGALRQKAAERDALYAGYALAQAENRELKQFLGRKESESRTLAAVLVSPPRAPYDSFVLDAGTDARRVRALTVKVLEDAASAGSTLLPQSQVVLGIRSLTIQPPCDVDADLMNVAKDDFPKF